MTTISVNFKGIKQFEKNIKALGGKVAKQVVKASLKKGGTVFIKQARSNLPPQYDTLKRSLKSAFRKPRNQFYQTLKIGFTTGKNARYDGWYAHIVEGGSDAHTITSKTGKIITAGDDVFARKINHPGTRAYPFLRPAFENKSNAALVRFRDSLWIGIKKNLKT